MKFHHYWVYYLNVSEKEGFTLRHIEEPVSYDGVTKNKDLALLFFAKYRK